MTRARMAPVAAVLFAMALTACSGDPTTGPSGGNTGDVATTPAASPSDTASSLDPLPTGGLIPSENFNAITVSDADAPEVTIPAPWATNNTQTRVLHNNSNAQVVGVNSTITVSYVDADRRTGAVFDSSFQRGREATFSIREVIAGSRSGLAGQKVGSRVPVGVAGADGYAQDNPQTDIQMDDSLVFVVDITAASYDEATGKTVAPATGLPTVTMTESKPEVTFLGGSINAEQLVVQPPIKGLGKTIEADSIVSAKYRVQEVKSGKMILNGWRGAQSGKLSILIDDWKTGLLGQIAGPRVMLVVPSADSFPNSEPSKGLGAGEGLVCVIDILDVRAASQQNWRNRSPSRWRGRKRYRKGTQA